MDHPALGTLGALGDAQLPLVEAIDHLAHRARMALLQERAIPEDRLDLRAKLRHARVGLPQLRIGRVLHPRRIARPAPARSTDWPPEEHFHAEHAEDAEKNPFWERTSAISAGSA